MLLDLGARHASFRREPYDVARAQETIGAAGLPGALAERLANGVDDRQALMIGIKCERGSYRFFKRYGEKFEDSEGKRIFLDFADEERAHLELLIREYRSLVQRQRRRPAARRAKRRTRRISAALS